MGSIPTFATMGIWFKDQRETKQECITAIEEYKNHGNMDKCLAEMDVSLNKIKIKKSVFLRQIQNLLMANNPHRAIKLVNVVEDFEPRNWWLIPMVIIMWPFNVIWKIIKLGLPSSRE